jgi:WD40 repeat protein
VILFIVGSTLLGAEPATPASTEALLCLHHILLADREISANNLARAEELLDACPSVQRRWEWHYLKRQCQGSALSLRDAGRHVVFSPDGKQIAVGDKGVKLLDAATGNELRGFESDQIGRISRVAFRPDGKQVAALSHNAVAVWDTEGGTLVFLKHISASFQAGLAYSPNGKWLATPEGSRGKASGIKLWESASGKEIADFRGHIGPVNGIAFAPDGKRLVSASEDMTIKFWDVEKSEEITTLRGHSSAVRTLAFSPDGKRLVSTTGSAVIVWDAIALKRLYGMGTAKQNVVDVNGKTVAQSPPPFRNGASAVIFTPDGERLVTGRYDGSIHFHNAATGEELFALFGHHGAPTSLSFRADGQLASADSEGTVKVWDVGRSSAVRTLLGHANAVNAVAFSPDGKLLASCSPDQTVRIWDLATGKDRLTVRHYDDRVKAFQPVQAVLFSPDGQRLYSAGSDRHMRAWNAQTGKPLFAVKDLQPPLAVSPDGKRFGAVAEQGVSIGDTETGKITHTIKARRPDGLTFSPDSKWIALCDGDWTGEATIQMWDAATGKELQSFRGQEGRPYSLTFSPDGNWLITAAGVPHKSGAVVIWDTATGKMIRTLRGHSQIVTSVAISPDGKRIVSADDSERAKVWNAELGLEILSYPNAGRFVTFSADGQWLATAGHFWSPTENWLGQIRLYDGRPLPAAKKTSP